MTVAYAVRHALRAGDYSPTPVNGKSPVLPSWQEKTDTGTADFNWWDERYAPATNTGVLTASMPTFDIDIKDPDAAVAIEETVKDWVGSIDSEVLVRFGNPPKRAIPFRTDKPFSKIMRVFQDSHGNTHRLEFLGEGQQIVVHGVHPDTGKPYSWHGNRGPDTVARDRLPPIDEAEARRLVDHCADILVQQFGFVEAAPVVSNGGGDNGHAERGPVDVEAELAAMTPDNVNDVHCRVIPRLLWDAEHPDDIVNRVATATMAMVQRHGLKDWTEETETKNHVIPRVRSAIKNLMMKNYDPATGEIPPWLCAAFHEDWAACLARGESPNISRNPHGFYVRGYDRNGTRANGHDDAPSIVPGGGAPATVLHQRRFPLIDFADLRPTDDEPYLIEELLPRNGLGVIWGKMKTFKSTFTLDMFCHVARGRPYHGLKVQQGRVIYCVFEGSHGYRNRMEALRRHYEILVDEVVPLHLMPASINLIKEKELLIEQIKLQLKERGVDDMPIAIVLDTLNRSLTGSESKDEDMGNYIKAADSLREAFGCFVAIVHHCGHDETRPRGHSSLPGAIDRSVEGRASRARYQHHRRG